MNLKDKSILIYDYGTFTAIAERLGRDFGKVYYYVPWQDSMPQNNRAIIGENLPNVTRVLDFWNWIDKVDCIFFPDTYCGDLVDFLKDKGYAVGGAGKSEVLELNRWKARQIQKTVGLPTQQTIKLTGINKLREYLQNNNDLYVKLNIFRGDLETFYHHDFESSEPLIDYLEYDLGRKGDYVEFILEEKINGIEPGIDSIVFDGKYYKTSMYGYENKDRAYICKIQDYDAMPLPIKEVNDKLLPVFDRLGTRSFFSTEIIIDESKKPYLIDPTVRMAAPTMFPVQCEIWENFSEVIWGLCVGEPIEPKPLAKYGGAIVFNSDWADKQWVKINFPPELSKWIKPTRGCIFDGEYYNVPCFTEVVTVCAIGDTVDEVVKLIKERAEMIKAYRLDKQTAPLDEIVEEINRGRQFGIDF